MGNARIKHVGSNFTIVPNKLLDDPNISYRAKGIYSYLRSKPDDWEFRVQNITRAGKEGRDATQKALKELEDSGYIERIANRASDGCFDGWTWYIYETPINREITGLTENPSDGFPVERESRPAGSQAEINHTVPKNNIHRNNINNNDAAEVQTVVDIFRKVGIHISPKTIKDISLLQGLPDQKIEHIASVLCDQHRKGRVKNPIGLLRKNPQEVIAAILDGTFYPDVPEQCRKKHSTASPKDDTQENEIYSPEPARWIICSLSAPNPKRTLTEVPRQLRRYSTN